MREWPCQTKLKDGNEEEDRVRNSQVLWCSYLMYVQFRIMYSVYLWLQIMCGPILICQVALVIKNLPANAEDVKRWGFYPWVRKIPRRRAWQPTPVSLSGESMDRGALCASIHSVTKSRTRFKWLTHTHTHTHTHTWVDLGVSCLGFNFVLGFY